MGARNKSRQNDIGQTQLPALDALCRYEQCRFCRHRVNLSKTPGGEGQCELELRGGPKLTLCQGRLFFSLSPEHAARYRSWLRDGAPTLGAS